MEVTYALKMSIANSIAWFLDHGWSRYEVIQINKEFYSVQVYVMPDGSGSYPEDIIATGKSLVEAVQTAATMGEERYRNWQTRIVQELQGGINAHQNSKN